LWSAQRTLRLGHIASAIAPIMKVKQAPEDFQVEELTDVVPTSDGNFAFYRLEKRGWTTPDAISVVRRRWKLDANRVSYGGLKDRHAHTVQYFTVFHGPRRGLKQQGIIVSYAGQLPEAYTSRGIRANRFVVTLRALDETECARAVATLEEIKDQGVPNYFDDQRFGSVGVSGEFVGRLLVLGQFENALRLALAAPYAHDRTPQKREKAILQAHWGNWTTCQARLPRGHVRRIFDYLASHPQDFQGALERLRPDVRGLYLSVYQSHLWNRMLTRWLQDHCPPNQLLFVRLRQGPVPVHKALSPASLGDLAALRLPLPSARMTIEPGDARASLVENVLHEEGLEQTQLKVRGLRKMFFSKGDRAALFIPSNLEHEVSADEKHPDRQKLVMSFTLPPGCYATLLLKRAFASYPTRQESAPHDQTKRA
jgi:tRNA pseudouridine13 synthase